jgi:hypothetical protein
VVNNTNVMDYFAQGDFNPVIPVDAFPANAFIWFQLIGLAHTPLTPGHHTITLDAVNTQPAFGLTFEYHNTWSIMVER